ncbi:type I secretion system permease/ATPase [Marinobacter persicus]|uniref:ATP-binding cassette, subfamily B, HlyB/CyaB n=1 Tax=Marinobacter persicus TaxID=930118 RepID=A0A2S6G224_9GAMM|nr:type I secretion system permease/ATPase [Marinobacter persicus]PPK49864.1 ATP-binding cassette, subfamily B, HlyB/CyaB [Marinobacter persicus]PPK51300.1 ATP-binding cassette, subfamily B, HlyB/CyaB [Marinobacter persicus]PPK55797.1 ATP-binding cassette, subfamily B, HlyB/CyaB [Marinobacter persicus]
MAENQDFDTGLLCFVTLARFHRIPVESSQLSHQFKEPDKPFDSRAIQLAARSIGLKCRETRSQYSRLDSTPLPAIAQGNDGSFFIIAKATNTSNDKGRVLIHDLRDKLPREVDEEELGRIWTGELFLLKKKGTLASGNRKFDISWFIPSLVKYRKMFGEVVLASFFVQLFALATPLFFQVVMDKVLVHKGFTTLDVLAIGFFGIIVFDAILGWLRNYIFSHTTNRVDVELGSKLFNHLLRLPVSFFNNRQVGQTVARVRELDTIRNFITGTALTLLIDLSFTLIFLAVMWYYSSTLTLFVLATIPAYVLMSVIITPILRRRLDEKFKYGAQNQAFLTETVSGAETVKTMAVEPQMQRKWEDQLSNYVNSSFRAQNLGNTANQIAGFISKLTTLFIIWWGAQLVIAGEMTVGQLVAFNMLAGRVNGPILKLVQLWQDFQQAGISLERLGDILNAPQEPGFDGTRAALSRFQGYVDFKEVKFRYDADGPIILDGINLSVKAGEVIGIVGRSGSGKSTLTKLIQRLHSPESGRVCVDGTDLSVIDTGWLRRNIGVVPQESYLFNRSIRENIALTNPALPMEKVVQAAKLAGAHEFISELPNGYDSPVGEHGCNLSGGQRQRIAIARALISNPRVLIFDEATSALDYESERTIQNNMKDICRGRTVFIIAHRLTAVRSCDRIVAMDKGRIVEQGTHSELMSLDGYYARMFRYQSEVPHIRPSGTSADSQNERGVMA